jgi:Uma2 family endonuclease
MVAQASTGYFESPELLAANNRAERRFVMRDVPWHVYVSLHDSLEAAGVRVRMTYYQGVLELMSPSETHEDYKKIIARLLEGYAEEMDIDLNGRGSTTFREEAKERGLEPDECYSVGEFVGRPDLAIEVAIGRPLIDKLAVYQGLAIREVWVWQNDHLVIHVLGDDGYRVSIRSIVLPAIDIALLTSFIQIGGSQTKLVKAYRTSLRAGSPSE